MRDLSVMVRRFVEGQESLSCFREEFLKVYLPKSSSWPTDSLSQLFFDRVVETVQEVGMPTERLHGDPRLESDATYRAYVSAMWDRYRDGTFSVNSPEY